MNKEQVVAVFSDRATQHQPTFDIYNGIPSASFDIPERAGVIIQELISLRQSEQLELAHPKEFDLPFVYAVHDKEYVEHLRRTSERLASKPPILVPEITDPVNRIATVKEYPAFAYPSVFPHGTNPQSHNRTSDRGLYAFDTATPIMGNTYEVALDAANCALTGAELLHSGTKFAYALCRPPGHHAERNKMGGYCYLNNAAIAAEYLRFITNKRVAVLDIDAHHGNGTQDIFYRTNEVFYTSLHVDTKEKPPYYTGYPEEKGQGAGYGYNLNIPLPIGTKDDDFLHKLEIALTQTKKSQPQFLIVSLGFDGHMNDPLELFKLTTDCYARAAKQISDMGIPVLSVQEGGYGIKDLPANISTYLKALTFSN